MKHFLMINAPKDRVEKYVLLSVNGSKEFVPIKETMKNLHRQGYAHNTIEQYAGHIAHFIDYTHEAALHTDLVTPEFIQGALDVYKSY